MYTKSLFFTFLFKFQVLFLSSKEYIIWKTRAIFVYYLTRTDNVSCIVNVRHLERNLFTDYRRIDASMRHLLKTSPCEVVLISNKFPLSNLTVLWNTYQFFYFGLFVWSLKTNLHNFFSTFFRASFSDGLIQQYVP